MGEDKLTKPKICFLALSSYPTLAKTTTQQIGGAEVQQILIAKELIKRGFDISFIVHDHGQKPIEIIDGITMYKIFPVDYKIKGAKIFIAGHSMWEALKHADADIYYQRAANAAAGIVALFCSSNKKKYVQSLASDKSLNGTYRKQVGPVLTVLYKWALKKADAVIVQSQHQQELLKKEFGRKGELIKSGYILTDENPKKSMHPIVLWVSQMSELKQAELFVKLAKKIPDANFQMIGGPTPDGAQYYEELKKSANETPNLDFLGFVPYQEVNQYFERAAIFVNTSTHEGFPNTFLQAWANYTPVVSINVDPDEIICNIKLGFHSKTFEQLILDVKRLLQDKQLRDEMGRNARAYVERAHDISNLIPKYEKLFSDLVSNNM